MADPLYLSLWFPDFSGPAMLPHMFAVLQQFPFSALRPGVTYASVQPVSWNEASVLERRFSPGITPEEAVVVAADLIHDDYAYVFDAYWDLWTPDETGHKWSLIPSLVKFIVQGEEFDDGTSPGNRTHRDRLRPRLALRAGECRTDRRDSGKDSRQRGEVG